MIQEVEKETRTSGPSKGSRGKVKQNGKGVDQNRSWFAALEDVDQEVDWAEKLEALKQKIQGLPGPGKDGPPINAHSRTKHKAHQLKQGSGSLSNERLILTNLEGQEEGPNRTKSLAQGKVSSQYQPKDNHKRKPLLEVSNNLKEQSQSSKVLEKGETTSRSGSLVAMNPQLGLKEMEVEPPKRMFV